MATNHPSQATVDAGPVAAPAGDEPVAAPRAKRARRPRAAQPVDAANASTVKATRAKPKAKAKAATQPKTAAKPTPKPKPKSTPAKTGRRAVKAGTRPVQAKRAALSAEATKTTSATKATKATQAVKASKGSDDTRTRAKLVRDSFTMPQSDFGLIEVLKQRALAFKRPLKKSELLRAGLHALTNLSDSQFKAIVTALATLKTGRPKKNH